MKDTTQGDDIALALSRADRSPGWNNRSREVRRFNLGECMLFVVPFRRWAYRRDERLAEVWRREREGENA